MDIKLLLLIILIVGSCLIILLVAFHRQKTVKESLTIIEPNTIVGGIVSTQMIFENGRTTMVRKLLGNSGKTIILLHNSPFDQQIWYSLFTFTQIQFAAGKEIPTLISYDITGHGTAWIPVDTRFNDTDPTNAAWSLDTFADELHQIYKSYAHVNPTTDKFDLGDKVVLVGYGVGSRIVQIFALVYPDLVEELFILQSGLGLVGDTTSEITYFSEWINSNSEISYLTIEEEYVRRQMCKWFQTQDRTRCPEAANDLDTIESYGSTEYLLADKLWRTASATTFLQISKIGSNADLRQRWLATQNKMAFPVIVLSSERDNYVSVANAREDVNTLKKAGLKVTGYITTGKHGFTIVQTDYIYALITGASVKNDSRTVQIL